MTPSPIGRTGYTTTRSWQSSADFRRDDAANRWISMAVQPTARAGWWWDGLLDTTTGRHWMVTYYPRTREVVVDHADTHALLGQCTTETELREMVDASADLRAFLANRWSYVS